MSKLFVRPILPHRRSRRLASVGAAALLLTTSLCAIADATCHLRSARGESST